MSVEIRCDYYDSYVHEGTQPIRVLIPRIIDGLPLGTKMKC